MTTENSNDLSGKLLLVVKNNQPHEEVARTLARRSPEQLQSDLPDDGRKKAFWINVYNAYYQILRKVRKLEQPQIFTAREIRIAGQRFSLDDIEHGILRKYRLKHSMGYLRNPFVNHLIRQLAVDQIDYRIHFALNCGAESCPPIAFYHPDRIDEQLEAATLAFLEGETKVYADRREIHVSRLFSWFINDFGGKKGIRRILSEKLELDTEGFQLKYRPYSWKEALDNYTDL